MRIVTPTALVAALVASTVSAAPAIEVEQHLTFNSPPTSGFLSLTTKLTSALSSVFSSLTHPTPTSNSEDQTIWDLINSDPEFSQLAHILNYSSDATKDILRKKEDLTLFAPLNWHHHRDGGDHDGEKEAYTDLSFGPASIQTWTGMERQIAEYEQEFGAHSFHHDGDSDDDDDEKKKKKHKREAIQHLIDAHALYHLVRSPHVLDAKAIADNSSVATWLNTGKSHPNNAGTDWRVRIGKSLLPLPAVYLNFYSRVVKPDIKTKNGLVQGIKYPLILPPDVLQSLFYGQTTFSTTTSGLQKVHAAKYLSYGPDYHHHEHHGHEGGKHFQAWHHQGKNGSDGDHFSGVAAETMFVPTNLAWSRLPFALRAYLFSPWGYHLLEKVFMLHALPHDIVYADFVHHVGGQKKVKPTFSVEGGANKTSYTFDSVLPAIHGKKGELEQVDVDVYRYYLVPGNKGPLQTRVVVQNVSVILQDIPASNGVYHGITRFIKPKGHPEKGVWAEVAEATDAAGYGKVDLVAEAQANLW